MIEYIPGLAKVPAAESSISFINGDKGILEYRGYRIEELAARSTFEEVTYLLLNGQLPTQEELTTFTTRVRAARPLPPELRELILKFPKSAHPMAALQACVAGMGMLVEPGEVNNPAKREESAIRFVGVFAAMIAAIHRARLGQDIIDPDPSLSRAADFLRMTTGEVPDEFAAKVMDVCLILHADHTMNASTFAARVVASTESELYSALVAAVGSLSGPLHGGANERVLVMLDEIGSKDRVAEWFKNKTESKQKIMGLGHRVYKTKDPRATILQGLTTDLFERMGSSPLYDIALELESIAAEKLGSRGIWPNVDYYSGIVYNKLGIPTDLFTPIFALSRISGWVAHWLEQMADNRLFRPAQIYTGERQRSYVPVDERQPGVETT